MGVCISSFNYTGFYLTNLNFLSHHCVTIHFIIVLKSSKLVLCVLVATISYLICLSQNSMLWSNICGKPWSCCSSRRHCQCSDSRPFCWDWSWCWWSSAVRDTYGLEDAIAQSSGSLANKRVCVWLAQFFFQNMLWDPFERVAPKLHCWCIATHGGFAFCQASPVFGWSSLA